MINTLLTNISKNYLKRKNRITMTKIIRLLLKINQLLFTEFITIKRNIDHIIIFFHRYATNVFSINSIHKGRFSIGRSIIGG